VDWEFAGSFPSWLEIIELKSGEDECVRAWAKELFDKSLPSATQILINLIDDIFPWGFDCVESDKEKIEILMESNLNLTKNLKL